MIIRHWLHKIVYYVVVIKMGFVLMGSVNVLKVHKIVHLLVIRMNQMILKIVQL
jgi:hypothetical protein